MWEKSTKRSDLKEGYFGKRVTKNSNEGMKSSEEKEKIVFCDEKLWDSHSFVAEKK